MTKSILKIVKYMLIIIASIVVVLLIVGALFINISPQFGGKQQCLLLASVVLDDVCYSV